MNPSDMNHLLKHLPAPSQPDEFWDALPQHVIRRLHTAPLPPPAPLRRGLAPVWAVAVAVVCLAVGIRVGFGLRSTEPPARTEFAPTQFAALYHEIAGQIPGNLQGIIVTATGVNMIVAPSSAARADRPLLVQVIGADAQSQLRVLPLRKSYSSTPAQPELTRIALAHSFTPPVKMPPLPQLKSPKQT